MGTPRLGRRWVHWVGLFWLLLASGSLPASAANDTIWQDLKRDLFGEKTISKGDAVLQLEAPARPQDAGLVPVEIRLMQPQSPDWHIKRLTLIADHNPVPIVGVFELAEGAVISQIATRIRVDQYSDLRVIAEASDGGLYMVTRFVKATGGCSAPAVGGADGDTDTKLGEMRLRQHRITTDAATPYRPPNSRALVLQIRHPNHSGFQKDPLQGYFLPAHFVQTITIEQNGAPLLAVEGAISLSENPSIRLDYVPQGTSEISVRAEDTEGNVFAQTWPLQKLQQESALKLNR